jgi:hypothetical protein
LARAETLAQAPTLDQDEVAEAVVAQIDSGLSGHVMQPLHARTLLPAVRFMPDWYRWFVHAAGKTHLTVTDDSGNAARSKYRIDPNEIVRPSYGLRCARPHCRTQGKGPAP